MERTRAGYFLGRPRRRTCTVVNETTTALKQGREIERKTRSGAMGRGGEMANGSYLALRRSCQPLAVSEPVGIAHDS